MAQAFNPHKPRPKHAFDDTPPLLRVELQTHRAKLLKEYEVKRLDMDKALAERLVMEHFHKPSPAVSCGNAVNTIVFLREANIV